MTLVPMKYLLLLDRLITTKALNESSNFILQILVFKNSFYFHEHVQFLLIMIFTPELFFV